jgi:hypothetical protein
VRIGVPTYRGPRAGIADGLTFLYFFFRLGDSTLVAGLVDKRSECSSKIGSRKGKVSNLEGDNHARKDSNFTVCGFVFAINEGDGFPG